jgi:two-component system response regulator DesR
VQVCSLGAEVISGHSNQKLVPIGSQGIGSLMCDGAPMRIIIADSDARARSAIAMLLRQEPGPLWIGEASDLESLLVTVQLQVPDLIFLEWGLPGQPAAAALFALSGAGRRSRVIVLDSPSAACTGALAAGASAVVGKDQPPEHLLEAFRRLRAELCHERQAPEAAAHSPPGAER